MDKLLVLRKPLLVLSVLLLLFLAAGCASSQPSPAPVPAPAPAPATPAPTPQQPQPAPAPAPAAPAAGPAEPLMGFVAGGMEVNGSADGYPFPPFQVGGMDLRLAHDGTNFYVHASAKSQGWIAVGFNERGRGMDGANMVLGAAEVGDGYPVRNDLGRGTDHAAVASQGIIDAVVLREGDTLVLEFSYPLAFPADGNYRIKGLSPGEEFSLITALQAQSGDFSRIHSKRGQINFRIEIPRN